MTSTLLGPNRSPNGAHWSAWGPKLAGWSSLVVALVFYFGAGYGGAYLVIFLLLLAIVWCLGWRLPIWSLRQNPASQMFLLAYALIVIAFVCSARKPSDIVAVGNFVILAAFVPINAMFGRLAAPRNAEYVAALALAGSILALGLAVYQVMVLGMPRATGGAGPIWGAEAVLIVGFLALIGWFAPTSFLPRPVYLLGPICAGLTAVLTGSRGPMLAIPVIMVALFATSTRRFQLALLLAAAAAIAAGVGIYLFWPSATSRVDSMFANIRDLARTGSLNDTSGSIAARTIFWNIGIEAFLHSPVVGYGWAHFLEAAYTYLPDHGQAFDAGKWGLKFNKHLHSDILDLGVSAGILGLFAYGMIIAAPLVGAFRSVRDSQFKSRTVGAIILSVGYFTCGLTYLMFGFEYHTTLFVVLSATIVGLCRDTPPLTAFGNPAKSAP